MSKEQGGTGKKKQNMKDCLDGSIVLPINFTIA